MRPPRTTKVARGGRNMNDLMPSPNGDGIRSFMPSCYLFISL